LRRLFQPRDHRATGICHTDAYTLEGKDSEGIFHGKMGLDQLFSARPMLGHADYRMPLPGLYLCGSGAHPGGGVTGAPGHNAARAILADRRKWRRAA
jgi:phytoene dehydrogenase-like protein